MATYSFMDVTASLVGPTGEIDFGYGSANADEGIVVSMGESKHTMTVGLDGGTIAVSLLKTSPVNRKLSLMYNAQSLSTAAWGKNVIVIRNKASGETVTARSVAFSKQPDVSNAKDVGVVKWEFNCGKIDQLLGEF